MACRNTADCRLRFARSVAIRPLKRSRQGCCVCCFTNSAWPVGVACAARSRAARSWPLSASIWKRASFAAAARKEGRELFVSCRNWSVRASLVERISSLASAGIPDIKESPIACRACAAFFRRSEEHTSELQSRLHLVCRLLLEKKKKKTIIDRYDVMQQL